MTVERELSSDTQVPFIATSILNGYSSVDRKPQLARLSIGENVLATSMKIADSRPTDDHATLASSGSAMATPSPAVSDSCVPTIEDGACWNLVPYDVPWGQDYYKYKQGTLPGPDGTCLFLRSPTPVEKRRTLQACKMCRERKAKCTGDKPACARCLARGYICQYLLDAKKYRPAKAGPLRLKTSRSLSHPYGRRDSDAHSIASSTDFSEYSSYSSASSSSYFSPKQEEMDFPPAVLLQQLQYPEEEEQKQGLAVTEGAYLPPYDHDSGVLQDSCSHEPPPPSTTSTSSSLSFWSGYESPHPPAQTLAPTPVYAEFHAPRPLRYSQSLPFLPSSEGRISCPADIINRSRSADPVDQMTIATTVDPRVLTQQPMAADGYPQQGFVEPQHQVADLGAVHANQWSTHHVHAVEYAAMQDGALLMQQYCNISPIAQYAQSHPVEPHLYQTGIQQQTQTSYEAVVSPEYVSPGVSYAFPAYSSAAPTFAQV